MQSGKLRERVTIQLRAAGQSSSGEPNGSWADVATVWANVEDLSGTERYAAQQLNPEISHTVCIRYYAGLTPEHRLLWGSRYLDIQAVLNPDGKKIEHQLTCIERVGSE